MDTKAISPEALALGQQIKKARLRKRLTGDDVRRLAGTHPTSLSFFERGIREPSPAQFRELARALGTTFRFAPDPVVSR